MQEEDKIQRKELWRSLNNIRQSDWEKAGKRLDLDVFRYYGKGDHYVIRDPAYPDPSDYRGLITTVDKDLNKVSNQKIFKQILNHGIPEDDIWRALKMFK